MGVDHPGAHLPPPAPLLERNPPLFWQALCAVLSLIVLAPLLYIQVGRSADPAVPQRPRA